MSDTQASAAKPNRSLQEKSSARMAAAQLLYRVAVTGDMLNPDKLIKDYQHYISDSADDKKAAKVPLVAPSPAFLRKLLEGIARHGEQLEPWVDKCLTNDWKKSRISPLLLAILRLAIFELAHFENAKRAVIINEYVTLTAHFFDDAETAFVNAALNSVANELKG